MHASQKKDLITSAGSIIGLLKDIITILFKISVVVLMNILSKLGKLFFKLLLGMA